MESSGGGIVLIGAALMFVWVFIAKGFMSKEKAEKSLKWFWPGIFSGLFLLAIILGREITPTTILILGGGILIFVIAAANEP